MIHEPCDVRCMTSGVIEVSHMLHPTDLDLTWKKSITWLTAKQGSLSMAVSAFVKEIPNFWDSKKLMKNIELVNAKPINSF